jgi:hypothetical protein
VLIDQRGGKMLDVDLAVSVLARVLLRDDDCFL